VTFNKRKGRKKKKNPLNKYRYRGNRQARRRGWRSGGIFFNFNYVAIVLVGGTAGNDRREAGPGDPPRLKEKA